MTFLVTFSCNTFLKVTMYFPTICMRGIEWINQKSYSTAIIQKRLKVFCSCTDKTIKPLQIYGNIRPHCRMPADRNANMNERILCFVCICSQNAAGTTERFVKKCVLSSYNARFSLSSPTRAQHLDAVKIKENRKTIEKKAKSLPKPASVIQEPDGSDWQWEKSIKYPTQCRTVGWKSAK